MIENRELKKLPIIALRDLLVFPNTVTHFDAGRSKTIAAIENAEMQEESLVFLSGQKDMNILEPSVEDLEEYGTVAKIKQIVKLPAGYIRVLVEGIYRARINKILPKDNYFFGEIEIFIEDDKEDSKNLQAAKRLLEEDLRIYQDLNSKLMPGFLQSVLDESSYASFVDTISGYLSLDLEDCQKLLEIVDVYDRMVKLHEVLQKEIEVLGIEKNIDEKVQANMNKVQKDYYLREQIKVIHKELGDSETSVVASYLDKLETKKLPQEVKEKALKEVEKLKDINAASPEYTVLVNYLDWIVDLPWLESSDESIDIKKARRVLDQDHYGLKEVKERILEFIAVRKLSKEPASTILCLLGPPGVGKTSIASSIARALDKEFVRMSLGGVRDEAEIRGHRRTYVGAMPGRIISLIKKAKNNNPVFLLDEIDKVGSDYRGDPAAGLLEVLDPEQNKTFTDHYLDLPFDLSKVFFITTANNIATIPLPLRDRMEIISLGGYTAKEKFEIANKYLLSKNIKEAGLKQKDLSISKGAIKAIIDYYTREAGVRALEKQISKIARKAALEIVEGKKEKVNVTIKNLKDYLGSSKFRIEDLEGKDQVGLVNGLAWTQVGGTSLAIEVTSMEGKGNLILTGSLGNVMKESAMAAMSYLASNAKKYGLNPDFRKHIDIHIHVPEGAVPKDGPSAGVTIATALCSALTGRPVDRFVAMTGEITLRGRVLPIGGLKEKLLAASRMGIKKVFIPAQNEKDLKEIEEDSIKDLCIVLVDDIAQILQVALKEKK